MEYIKQLDSVSWKDRDYKADDAAYKENMNIGARDESYVDQFKDAQLIADKVLGTGWEEMNNDYTNTLETFVSADKSLMQSGAKQSAFYNMKMFLNNLDTARDYAKSLRTSQDAKPAPIEFEYEHEGDSDYESGYATPPHEPIDWRSGPRHSLDDLAIMSRYGIQPRTPPKPKTPSSTGGYTHSAPPASADDTVSVRSTVTPIQYPDYKHTFGFSYNPDPGTSSVLVRPLQFGVPRTKYFGNVSEVSVPEPSHIHFRMMHEAQARQEKPLSTRHSTQTHIGDYIVLEKTAERLRVEVNAPLPRKTTNRLVNLMWIHGKKIAGAILNRLIDGEERSYGAISKMNKANLRALIKSLQEHTIFIVQGPVGAGLGALDSPFWTHWSVAHYLTRK